MKYIKKRLSNYSAFEIKKMKWGYIFVLPSILFIFILQVIPEFQTLYYSFTKVSGFKRNKVSWIGLENYKSMLTSSDFWQAFNNTFIFALLSIPVTVLFSVFFGIILNNNIKFKSIFRTISFIPIVVPPVAIGLVWSFILDPNFGLLNSLLGKKIYWLTDSSLAMISIVIISVWAGTGYWSLMIIAGLQTIPNVYYEAAKLDGASPIQILFRITIPLLSPTIFMVTVLVSIYSLQVFDIPKVILATDNPAYLETRPLLEYFYQYAFVGGKYGFASVAVMLLLLAIGLITFFQFWVQKRWVHYE